MTRVCDDFHLGAPLEDTISNAYLADKLLDYICPAGEPWTADTPWLDHGHTDCMWIGLAVQRLRAMS
jgi:hypothetical protein